jgi:hypothetical protein
MPGLGTIGTYTDENDNQFVAIVVGRTFTMATVWRNPAGEIVPDPTPTVPVPPGSTSKLEKVENGNLEVATIFRDSGGLNLKSNVPPSAIIPVVA